MLFLPPVPRHKGAMLTAVSVSSCEENGPRMRPPGAGTADLSAQQIFRWLCPTYRTPGRLPWSRTDAASA